MRGNADAARGLVGGDGDGLAVAQGDGHRRLRSVGQGGGVNDLAAFSHARRRRQRHGGGVLHVGDCGADRRFVSHQVFVISAGHIADAVGNGCMALIDIIADGAGGGARALADRDGNGLPIGQADHDRATSDGRAYGGGVEDDPAFGHRWRGRQGDCGGVRHVRHAGTDLGLVCDQVLVTAARHVADAVGDRGMALINIIAHGAGGSAGALADRDGDALAIGQGHHDGAAGNGGTHGGGVEDGAAFGHGWRGRQGDCGGVRHIRDAGADRRLVSHQVFVISAGHIADAVGHCGMALIDVVGDCSSGGAGTLPDRDGDGLAVTQGDGHRRLGGVGQGGGVNDLAAFSHAWRRRQRDRGGVLHVGDAGTDRRFVSHQVFVITTGHVADAVGDGGMALIDVVADGARGSARALADRDGNRLAIGQCDDDRAAGDRCAHGGGVEDGAAFDYGWCGCQADGGGVPDIGDRGADDGSVRHQVFVVAATDGRDAVGDGLMALIDVVGDCRRCGPRTLPDWDSDALAIGQGDHDGSPGDRCGDRGGIDDAAAFGHRWSGGQAHGRGVDGIGDVGHCWRAVNRQVLEVASAGVGDARADLAGIEVRVIAMGGNVDAAGGLIGGDGYGLAVTQGDGHRRLCGVGQGGGVNDLAAFGHARGR